MGEIVLRDDDQAAGFFVETVNDAGPKVSADFREGLEAMKQSVHQRAAIASVFRRAGASMHHHACGLYDDGEVLVLIDHIERNVFGYRPQRWRLIFADDFDGFAATKLVRGLGLFAIDEDFLVVD